MMFSSAMYMVAICTVLQSPGGQPVCSYQNSVLSQGMTYMIRTA